MRFIAYYSGNLHKDTAPGGFEMNLLSVEIDPGGLEMKLSCVEIDPGGLEIGFLLVEFHFSDLIGGF
jgi:hypothetical protein